MWWKCCRASGWERRLKRLTDKVGMEAPWKPFPVTDLMPQCCPSGLYLEDSVQSQCLIRRTPRLDSCSPGEQTYPRQLLLLEQDWRRWCWAARIAPTYPSWWKWPGAGRWSPLEHGPSLLAPLGAGPAGRSNIARARKQTPPLRRWLCLSSSSHRSVHIRNPSLSTKNVFVCDKYCSQFLACQDLSCPPRHEHFLHCFIPLSFSPMPTTTVRKLERTESIRRWKLKITAFRVFMPGQHAEIQLKDSCKSLLCFSLTLLPQLSPFSLLFALSSHYLTLHVHTFLVPLLILCFSCLFLPWSFSSFPWSLQGNNSAHFSNWPFISFLNE